VEVKFTHLDLGWRWVGWGGAYCNRESAGDDYTDPHGESGQVAIYNAVNGDVRGTVAFEAQLDKELLKKLGLETLLIACGHQSLPPAVTNKRNGDLSIKLVDLEYAKDVTWPDNYATYYGTDWTGFRLTLKEVQTEIIAEDACWLGPKRIGGLRPITIMSPMNINGGGFPAHQHCSWHIEAPCGYRVTGKFTQLAIGWREGALLICDSQYDQELQQFEKSTWDACKDGLLLQESWIVTLFRYWGWNYGISEDRPLVMPDDFIGENGNGEMPWSIYEYPWSMYKDSAGFYEVAKTCYREAEGDFKGCSCTASVYICEVCSKSWMMGYCEYYGWSEEFCPTDCEDWHNEWLIVLRSYYGALADTSGFKVELTYEKMPEM